MVPGPRIRESRSPLDSRGPLPRRQGASSFLRATARAGVLPGLRRGARSRRHGMSVHAACGSRPLRKILEGPFLFFPAPPANPAPPRSPPPADTHTRTFPPAFPPRCHPAPCCGAALHGTGCGHVPALRCHCRLRLGIPLRILPREYVSLCGHIPGTGQVHELAEEACRSAWPPLCCHSSPLPGRLSRIRAGVILNAERESSGAFPFALSPWCAATDRVRAVSAFCAMLYDVLRQFAYSPIELIYT